MKNTLISAIKWAVKQDKIRMHMPGAKGRSLGFLGGIFKYDFTEIDGLDNLCDPGGIIRDAQNRMAEDINAGAVMYLVNGSSTGVLAMLSLFKSKRVLMARDFHMSAANAIDLFDISPVFIYPEQSGVSAVVTAEQVQHTLEVSTDIAAVYLTYPNYYGFCPDLKAIASITHRFKIPFIVDAAHAACFPYSEMLPESPAASGVDAWVVSTHKTLPALNQSAYLAVGKNGMLKSDVFKAAVNQIQTTSPSYPLLASIEFAHHYMMKKGSKRIRKLVQSIARYSEKIEKISGFNVIKGMADAVHDPLKWVIDYQQTGLSHDEVRAEMLKRGLHAEAVDAQCVLLLISPVDPPARIRSVYRVLKSIKIKKPIIPIEPEMRPRLVRQPAQNLDTEWILFEQAEGRTAAQNIAVYPPGIPLAIKGDRMNAEAVTALKNAVNNGLPVVGLKNGKVLVYVKDHTH